MMKIVNRRVIFFICIALVAATVAAIAHIILYIILSVLMLTAASGGFLFCAKCFSKLKNFHFSVIAVHFKSNRFLYLALFLAVFLGGGRALLTVSDYSERMLPPSRGILTGRVDAARMYDNSGTLTLSNCKLNLLDEQITLDRRVLLTVFSTGEIAETGDMITASCEIYSRNIKQSGEIDGFAYAENIGYRATCIAEDYQIIAGNQTVFERMREALLTLLLRNMPYRGAVISYGVLCGDTSVLDDSQLSASRSLGVAHIFAVSGLHVGLIVSAASFLLKKMRANAYLRFALIAALIVFYNLFCGFAPSILRSSIMFGCMLLANCVGSYYDSLTALSFSAIVNILLFPLTVFYVGFALSYAAIFGILTLAPPLKRCFRILPPPVCSALSSSLAVSISLFPISIAYFSETPIFGALVNVVAIPIFGLLFVALIAFLLPVLILPPIQTILLVPGYLMLGFTDILTQAAEVITPQVYICTFGAASLLAYLLLFALSDFNLLKRRAKLALSITLALMCMCAVVIIEFPVRSHAAEITLIEGGDRATFVEYGGENLLIVAGGDDDPQATIAYLHRRRIRKLDRVIYTEAANDCVTHAVNLFTKVPFARVLLPKADGTESVTYQLMRTYSHRLGFLFETVSNETLPLLSQQTAFTTMTVYTDEQNEPQKTAFISSVYLPIFSTLLLPCRDLRALTDAERVYRGTKIRHVIAEAYPTLAVRYFSPNAVYSHAVEAFLSFPNFFSTKVYGNLFIGKKK